MRPSSDLVARAERPWRVRGRTIGLGRRTLVMGIVNVTPDSFSDGGRYLDPAAAIRHAETLIEEGADILDVGGESTRPGSDAVPDAEETRRIRPVIEALAQSRVAVSADTRKASVAQEAVAAGAHILNDVSALGDPSMARVAASSGAGLVLMHMLGEPKSMQINPAYRDLVGEICAFLGERAERALAAGVRRDSVMLDPGIGFGKRTGEGIEDNASILRHLPEFGRLGFPLLVGASRKSFIGNVLKLPLKERLEGSLAAAAIAAWQGADVVRVHDVKSTRRVVDLVDAVRNSP